MNTPLNYTDLYSLAEEWCQLKAAQLQEIVCESADRYYLKFFSQGIGVQWLIIDLTPAQPFILSINSAVPRKQKSTTPVLNFLKAHFKGLRLTALEVAQKPNRTLRFNFENKSQMIFQCFPHGQCLALFSDGKKVFYPLGHKLEEGVSYVEPEVKNSWELNQQWSRRFFIFPKQEQIKTAPKEGRFDRQIAKLQKSLKTMEGKKEDFLKTTQDKIAQLEASAQEMKMDPDVSGKKLTSTYEEIKKLKRRILEYGEKQNETQRRIHFLTHQNESAPAIQEEEKSGPYFAGTRVAVDSQWQFWVGRKAIQNDELVKLANPHELWFHLRDYPSAHGILRGPKKSEPSPKILDFCCQVLAQLSQNKKRPFSEGEPIDFIITPRKFVKKKKGSPAGTVYVERETVRRVAYKIVKFDVL